MYLVIINDNLDFIFIIRILFCNFCTFLQSWERWISNTGPLGYPNQTWKSDTKLKIFKQNIFRQKADRDLSTIEVLTTKEESEEIL